MGRRVGGDYRISAHSGGGSIPLYWVAAEHGIQQTRNRNIGEANQVECSLHRDRARHSALPDERVVVLSRYANLVKTYGQRILAAHAVFQDEGSLRGRSVPTTAFQDPADRLDE